MSGLDQRLERLNRLSPAKRAILLQALRHEAGEAGAAERIPRRTAGGPAPLSFAQQRLWFLDQLEPGSPLYNLPTALRIGGPLRRDGLEAGLRAVVQRHEVLRASARAEGGEPVQVVGPVPAPLLPLVDLAGLPSLRREAELERCLAAEARRPFDLERGPLTRSLLFRAAADDHALLLILHHIVSDGWSMEVLLREVLTVYGQLAAGRQACLPELPIQYADFAVWQRAWLSGPALAAQLAYWRRELAGLAPLDLPTDRPRKAASRCGGAQRFALFPGSLLASLQALCRREESTLFAALLAGFASLLQRSTGARDIAVGSPFANRNRPEIEGLIGLFVNTLVLRLQPQEDQTFRDLLRAARATVLRASAHQDLPFDKLVQELEPERSLERTPLFQVLFALQNVPAQGGELPGLRLSPLRVQTGVTDFALTAVFVETAEGRLRCGLEHSRELFDATTIERLLDHLGTLLGAAVEQPDRPLRELPVLNAGERHAVLVEWNDTAAEADGELTLHGLVARQCALRPEATAATLRGQRLTYGALAEDAGRLARRLRSLGVGPEVRAAVYLERSLEMLVALLAVLQAGGAYVPLDTDYPEARLRQILDDSGARVVVSSARLAPHLPAGAWELACVDREEAIGAHTAAALRETAGAWSAAYVIYTSGSTGRPKGTVVDHGSLVSYARALVRRLHLGADDRMLQFASIGFDVAVEEIFPIWAAGGAVVLEAREVLASPAELLAAVARDGVTCMELPTAYWHELVREVCEGALRLPECLRLVLVGGEAISGLRVRQWQSLGVDLVHVFGLTEVTVTSMTFALPAGSPAPLCRSQLPVGRPLAGSRVYVLDRALDPVPLGSLGDLYFGGTGVGRGYLGRPDLTAERFVPDPYGGPGGRLYRTGDLARCRAEGDLEFLGRIDDQIKIRGFRVEPREIEAALAACTGVRESFVTLGVEGRLVAYIVAQGPALATDDLRSSLAARLPAAMVPTSFVMLAALPLTANGKVDRQALPRPQEISEREGPTPRTPVEEMLAGIWCEVLGLPQVGVDESFFALGGHSLLATRVMARIRALFHLEMPLRELFDGPTIAALARRVEAGLGAGPGLAAPPLVPVPRQGGAPLSFAQERLWFLDRLAPGMVAYNVPLALLLTGALDEAALRHGVAALVRRHEALRTSFHDQGGYGRQRVAPAPDDLLLLVDLSGVPDALRDAEARRLASEEARRPFDLSRAPLLRASLVRLAPERHLALLTTHHIVSDGWSMDILLRELAAFYAAAREGVAAVLPSLLVQYADFSCWQREWLQGETLATLLGHWRERLAGSPSLLALPTDRPRPRAMSFRGKGLRWQLPEDLSDELAALARREGATVYIVLLAAFQALLARYSGQTDVSVGTAVAGRGRVEVEGIVGLFLNTLVLRTDLSGEPGFAEVVRRARETTLQAHRYADLPFERLVEELRPERTLGFTPLFQVMFEYEHASPQPPALAGLAIAPVNAPSGTAKFDLTLAVTGGGRRLGGAISFSTDLFDSATVSRLAEHYRLLLSQVVRDGDTALGQLRLLAPAEQHQIVHEWSGRAQEELAEGFALELFERQASREPDASALLCGTEEVSYGDLDRGANRLARFLRRHGVGPDVLVGLCIERSPAMVEAVLAVLKAGGAYVPLDPSHPRERLGRMLAEASPLLLLTQERWLDQLSWPLTLCVDHDSGLWAAEDAAPLPRLIAPANLAYVIHTSGSTGRPKGVLGTHRGLSTYLRFLLATYGFGPADVTLQMAPLTFDASVRDILGPLSGGARLVLLRQEDARDPQAILAEIRSRRVTCLPSVVTPLFSALLDTAQGQPRMESLRLVLVAGESLRLAECRRAEKVFGPAVRVANQYGATECTMTSSLHWVGDSGEAVDRELAAVGRPRPGARLHVLGPAFLPVPAGVAGEVHIGGLGVGRGYLRRPELSAERFVPDPFSDRPGGRLYRTGDLGRYRADGVLEILGRIDFQVKVRGVRVEPDEVAAVLAECPGVLTAAVVARPDAAGEIRLVAYVVPEAGPEATAEALRGHLRERLPEVLLPSAFVVLASLPLTPNGKLDRAALPQPDIAAAAGPFVAPRDAVEEGLARIWVEVLGVPRAGAFDNFFDLGGHSLSALRVVSRVREVFGVELSLRRVFELPILADLACDIPSLSLSGDEDLAEIARNLDILERLSEDEVRELLQERLIGA